jgi:heme-degrading monooxygenase HmoA
MYARVSRFQAAPDRVDDQVDAFMTHALPVLQSMPGYAGHSLAVDQQSGDGQAVSFWESKEALAATREQASGLRAETLQKGGATVTSVKEYEQLLMETATRASAPAYIRVTRGQLDLSKLDGLVAAMRDEAVPALRALDGFRAVVVAVDRESSSFVITTVWDSAATREASDSAIDELRRRIFSNAGASAPEVARYEVKSVEFVGAGATRS